MTDFGGSGHGGTVAECELNIPVALQSGTSLTCNDLNLLGCSTSTNIKLGHPERIESNDSGFSSNSYRSDLKSDESSSMGQQEEETVRKKGDGGGIDSGQSSIAKDGTVRRGSSSRRASRSSKHFMRGIIAAVTAGFANCSK